LETSIIIRDEWNPSIIDQAPILVTEEESQYRRAPPASSPIDLAMRLSEFRVTVWCWCSFLTVIEDLVSRLDEDVRTTSEIEGLRVRVNRKVFELIEEVIDEVAMIERVSSILLVTLCTLYD
jgi:hypothetical protein